MTQAPPNNHTKLPGTKSGDFSLYYIYIYIIYLDLPFVRKICAFSPRKLIKRHTFYISGRSRYKLVFHFCLVSRREDISKRTSLIFQCSGANCFVFEGVSRRLMVTVTRFVQEITYCNLCDSCPQKNL